LLNSTQEKFIHFIIRLTGRDIIRTPEKISRRWELSSS